MLDHFLMQGPLWGKPEHITRMRRRGQGRLLELEFYHIHYSSDPHCIALHREVL